MDFKKWKRFDTPIVWCTVLVGLPVGMWVIWGVFLFAEGPSNWGIHGDMQRLDFSCPAYCG